MEQSHFVEPEGSLRRSQESANGSYSESDKMQINVFLFP